jgi:hypothetical protein
MKPKHLKNINDQELKLMWVALNRMGHINEDEEMFLRDVANNEDAQACLNDASFNIWETVDKELKRRGARYLKLAGETFLEYMPTQ